MTDLEMTRLCAEAMGYALTRSAVGPWAHDEDGRPTYNPLTNDAQAMALVKKLGLDISGVYRGEEPQCRESWIVFSGRGDGIEAISTDLNRAIVECVAKMRRAK